MGYSLYMWEGFTKGISSREGSIRILKVQEGDSWGLGYVEIRVIRLERDISSKKALNFWFENLSINFWVSHIQKSLI